VVDLLSVQYTPGQLCTTASISPQTYRHWKKTLAPLRRGRGHSPCFSPGDLVAVAVVRTLCLEVGVRVGALRKIANTLFKTCNASPWQILERGKLALDIANGELKFQQERANVFGECTLVIVQLRPIIERLRSQLLAASDHEIQRQLRFPPLPVTPQPRRVALRGRS
jgi:hypothetical protein